jgi:hypothetical protein
MWVVSAGLVAGCMHVISGPDHLVALAPIAAGDRTAAFKTGSIWGLGHGLGVAAVGGLGIGSRQFIDVGALSRWAEFVVGIALIMIGSWAIHKALKVTIHSHAHPVETAHVHYHVHTGEQHSAVAHQGYGHAALGVGFLHGAAGVGHLFGVLPALALPPASAVVYITAYLIAAVVSMGLFGGVLGAVLSRGGESVVRRVILGTGVLAIVLGGVWSVRSWPL